MILGHIWVKVKLGDPEKRKVVEVEALVDTGATLTVIPRKLAEQLSFKITCKTVS